MRQLFVKLTVEVTSASDRLTGVYPPKDLHRLRIGIRRIRSLLNQVSDRNARHFRKTWGGFAAVTNQALFAPQDAMAKKDRLGHRKRGGTLRLLR